MSLYLNTHLTDKPEFRGRNENHVKKLFPVDDYIRHPGDSGTDVALGIGFHIAKYLLITLHTILSILSGNGLILTSSKVLLRTYLVGPVCMFSACVDYMVCEWFWTSTPNIYSQMKITVDYYAWLQQSTSENPPSYLASVFQCWLVFLI